MDAIARWLIGCAGGLLNWRNRLYNTLVTYELLRGIDGIEQGGIRRADKFRDVIGRLQGGIELAQALLLAVLTMVVAASAGVFSFVHRLLHFVYRILKGPYFSFKFCHPHLDMGEQYR